MSPLTLYTVGHSNHTSESLIALLDLHAVRMLVDVRSTPHSQFNPQFNQSAIKLAVEQHGLAYKYAGEFLGGRPKDPALFKTAEQGQNSDSWAYPDVNYEAVMRSDLYQRGIARLLQLAVGTRLAIMCSEGNPLDCHRHHLIARSLVDPLVKVTEEEVTVNHINRDGSLTTVRADDFNSQLSLF